MKQTAKVFVGNPAFSKSLLTITLIFGFIGIAVQPDSLAAQNAPSPSRPTLLISEFVAVNDAGLKDEDGDESDWLELYNYGENSVDLTGLHLTDDAETLDQWRFPDTQLASQSYLLVFLSGKDRTDPEKPLHTNFSLNGKGEYLALVDRDATTAIHQYAPDFPKQSQDSAFGIAPTWNASQSPVSFESALEIPTPGSANAAAVRGQVKSVKFNKRRGWRSKAFELKLKSDTKGATIRYTLDSTQPSSENGLKYESPIPINGTTIIRAIATKPRHRSSQITTRTYLFAEDIVKQSTDGLPPQGFPYHWGNNKVDYGMDPAVVNDPEYGDEVEKGFYSLPTFSVVMKVDDLFDREIGIYSNAERDGIEWERPCSLELIHGDDSKGFQIDCGIRIRGGFSRRPSNPKHSFRLFFRDAYGPSKLDYRLFGKNGAKEFDNIDFRTFQNYSWHLGDPNNTIFVRDQYTRDLQLALGQPAPRGEFCHLFINGQYWGMYNTCERIKAGYGATYFGGKKSDYDAIKKGRHYDPETKRSLGVMANDGNLKAWERLWNAAKAGLESNDAYFKVQGRNPDGTVNPEYECLLDPDNLIDYMLVIFYSGNYDGPVSAWGSNFGPNNWYGLRNRERREGFRFFVWDAEHTFRDVREDRTGPFPAGGSFGSSNPQWLWQQCLANEEFRVRVGDRIQQHCYGDGPLTPDQVIERFLSRVEKLKSAAYCESARWGDARFTQSGGAPGSRYREPYTPDQHWWPVIEKLVNDYFPQRTEILLAQLYGHGVISDVPPPKFQEISRTDETQAMQALVSDVGELFYTTDGSDPRDVGGATADSAQLATDNRFEIPTGHPIKARVRYRDDWSALVHAP